MFRVHATSRILDSVVCNARSRVPFRQPTTAAALALLPAAREPLLVVRSVGRCESRAPSRRCRVSLIARSPWNSELRVSSTRNFCRPRNNLAFKVPMPRPRISAVSLTVRSSSWRRTAVRNSALNWFIASQRMCSFSRCSYISAGFSLDPQSSQGTTPRVLISRRQERFPSETDSSSDT